MAEALHGRMASLAAKLALADGDTHTYADARELAVMATEARGLDTRLAALEAVAAAARAEHDGRWEPECRICAALVALDALEVAREESE